jgi:archaellin
MRVFVVAALAAAVLATGGWRMAQQATSTLRITDHCTLRSDYTIDDKVVTPSQRDSLVAHVAVAIPVTPGSHVVRVTRYDAANAVLYSHTVTIIAPGTLMLECR